MTPELPRIGINIADKSAFNEIKSIFPQESYVECGKCGAIKVGAKIMAEYLNGLLEKYYNDHNDNLHLELLSELARDIINAVIEPEPPFEEVDDWWQWDEKNYHRKCEFLDGYEYAMYIKYSEAVVYFDSSCKCFAKNELIDNIKFILEGDSWSCYT